MGYHLVEGWPLVTTMGSMEDGEMIHHVSHVSVGQMVDVKIASVKSFGLVLKIGERLQGICPTMHVGDAAFAGQNLQKRFKVLASSEDQLIFASKFLILNVIYNNLTVVHLSIDRTENANEGMGSGW